MDKFSPLEKYRVEEMLKTYFFSFLKFVDELEDPQVWSLVAENLHQNWPFLFWRPDYDVVDKPFLARSIELTNRLTGFVTSLEVSLKEDPSDDLKKLLLIEKALLAFRKLVIGKTMG